ncbi:MAG: hypothetical protein ABJF10_29280 [Chthoniobacter sp.]|uniref:hypothetical protein n=1 Tax=Chthoniobacter sp. TaxID=2510640 RepID=UPI0032A9D4A6
MNTGRNLEPAMNLAEHSRAAARETMMREIEELRKDVDRLLLINEAIWRIAKERLNCSDADLVQRIHDIDLEDGHLDGRKAPSPPRACPHCERPLSKHRPSCVFCGKPVEFLPFER